MRTRIAAVSLALMLMASTASPGFAATSPEGATALKKQVEEALAFPLSLGKGYGEGLTLSGPVEVTTKGDYYEVKLPGAKVGIAMGFKLDIGTITINITPASDGSLETAIAVPESVRAVDDTGAVLSELKIGTQRFNGTWRPDLTAFTKLEAEYSNISLKGTTESNFSGTINSIKAYVNLTKNDDDTWSGPYGMSGDGVKISIANGLNAEGAIASFKADSTYEKINLKSRKVMQDSFSDTLAKAFANGQPTPEQAGQMMQKMMESMSGFLDGMGSNVELSGITINSKPDTASNPQAQPFNASIDKASMVFDVKGMLQPKGSTTLKMKLEGLKPDADPAVTGMIPNNANLEIYLENLPMQSLGSTLANALGGVLGTFGGMGLGAVDPAKQQEVQQQTQAQMLSLMTTVPQQLVSAGTQISIRNTYTDSSEFDTNLDGAFKANATSPMMADGKLTLTLKGVDELILKLQSLSQGPNANPHLAGYATMLSMLQVYTKPEQGPDGKSVRKLVFELAPDGAVLLNGQPMQGMIPGAAPAVPGMPPEQPTP